MIVRRSLLAAILGSPLMAAKVDVEEVAPLSNGLSADPTCEPDMPSPLQKALNAARQRIERRQDAKSRPIESLPPHIFCKKSWSSAFKSHVYTQEYLSEPRLYGMSDDELLAFLAKRGIEVLSK